MFVINRVVFATLLRPSPHVEPRSTLSQSRLKFLSFDRDSYPREWLQTWR